MRQINFLSEQYLREQGRRNRVYREGTLIVIVCLTMAAWGGTSWRQLSALKMELQTRTEQSADLQRQTDQYVQMQQQFNELQHQVKVQRELLMPIGVTEVVATIGQLMPESLTCRDMVITATEPKPRPVQTDATKKASPPPVQTPMMRVEIVGLAPTDTDVANFVDQLTAHPVFEAVKLDYTRPTYVAEVAARLFRIEMQIPLNRQYKPASGQNEEVAHAG